MEDSQEMGSGLLVGEGRRRPSPPGRVIREAAGRASLHPNHPSTSPLRRLQARTIRSTGTKAARAVEPRRGCAPQIAGISRCQTRSNPGLDDDPGIDLLCGCSDARRDRVRLDPMGKRRTPEPLSGRPCPRRDERSSRSSGTATRARPRQPTPTSTREQIGSVGPPLLDRRGAPGATTAPVVPIGRPRRTVRGTSHDAHGRQRRLAHQPLRPTAIEMTRSGRPAPHRRTLRRVTLGVQPPT